MSNDFIKTTSQQILDSNPINRELYVEFDVKRGLRNADGSGVLAGLTKISGVVGSKKIDGKLTPVDGALLYRGINIREIVEGIQKEGRHGFAEVAYLLLFGKLPAASELEALESYLYSRMELPKDFVDTGILKFTSKSVMNSLQKVVLGLYALDNNADDVSVSNLVRQSLELVAKFPAIIAYSFIAMHHQYEGGSLYIHQPKDGYDIAQNFLHMLRQDSQFTPLEAELLDLSLVLHAEHGGGNNSSFTTHVVSSSQTDTYAAIGAAIGALKGPLHGAANSNVMYMMDNIKENVKDWADRDEVAAYIEKIVRKEAHDKTGLVYGMGHAVYTKSDPRAIVLKGKARELAEVKSRLDEFNLYLLLEELTPSIFQSVKKSDKVIAPNVDFFSGFVYDMLGFSTPIYTPLFAMARIVGWAAHRIDELINGGRIIRPGYKSVADSQHYTPIAERV